MALTVKASNGADLPIDSLAQVFAYDGSGNVETITVEYAGVTYVQTFTYSGDDVTDISNWIAQ